MIGVCCACIHCVGRNDCGAGHCSVGLKGSAAEYRYHHQGQHYSPSGAKYSARVRALTVSVSIHHTQGPEGGSFQFGGWLAGSLSQAFVFYGFESAADVSEEVMSAKKSVPRYRIMRALDAAARTDRLTCSLHCVVLCASEQ